MKISTLEVDSLKIKSVLYNIFYNKGRTAAAARQIFYSFIMRGITIGVGIIYVPLLLHYLTQEKYGVWLTLTSILGWFSFFDIGLGNGLRNKLAEAFAKDNKSLGRKYVSTTYALLFFIFGIVLILFHVCNKYIAWNKILNTYNIDQNELYLLTSIVFSFFILRFIFQVISVIYLSDQKPSINNAFSALSNLLSLFSILLLIHFSKKENIVLLGAIISSMPVLVFIGISIFAFNRNYKYLRPSIKNVDLSLKRGLMGLGVKFFFLQITYIIIFSTSSFIVSQFYGPAEVVIYNISFKYYQLPIMVFSTIISPLWSSVTDAYVKKDFVWLKTTIKRVNILSLIFTIAIIIMVLFNNTILELWVGPKISIPTSLTIGMAIYSIMQVLFGPYSMFINGIGKIKMAMLFTGIEITVYIISIFSFAKIFHSSFGIILAIITTSIIGGISKPIQTYKLLNRTATGIWNK